MLEAEESNARLYFVSHFMTQAKPRVTHETLYLEDFKCDLSYSLPYYIYPHYPQYCEEGIQRENPRMVSTTQHTHFLERESYSSFSEKSL